MESSASSPCRSDTIQYLSKNFRFGFLQNFLPLVWLVRAGRAEVCRAALEAVTGEVGPVQETAARDAGVGLHVCRRESECYAVIALCKAAGAALTALSPPDEVKSIRKWFHT